MISADQGFGDEEQMLLDAKEYVRSAKEELAAEEEEHTVAKEDLVAAKEEHTAAKEKYTAAKAELAAAKEELAAAKEESMKEHYSWMMDHATWMMDHAKREVDRAKRGVDRAKRGVDWYKRRVNGCKRTVDYYQNELNFQLQRKISNQGWEPRRPSANWEQKLTFFGSRDYMIDIFKSYVSKVKCPPMSQERRDLDPFLKGMSMCSAFGPKGMGKTVCLFLSFFLFCLCHSYRYDICLQALLRRVHQKPSLVGATKAIFINCGSDEAEGVIPKEILSRSLASKILASSLLYSSANEPHKKGFLEFCLSVDCSRRAVQLIRSNLKMDDSDMLLILVDELGNMGEQVIEPQNQELSREWVLWEAMGLMDATNAREKGGNIAFIFSALVWDDLKKPHISRVLYRHYDTKLTPLSWEATRTTVEQMFEHDAAALNLLKNGKIVQLLKQCYGHPRCVHLSFSRCNRLLSLRLAYGCHSLNSHFSFTPPALSSMLL